MPIDVFMSENVPLDKVSLIERKKTEMQNGSAKPTYLASEEGDRLSEGSSDATIPSPAETIPSPADTLSAKSDASSISDEEDRIVLNVGGVRHETHLSTLRNITSTRLSRLAEQHMFSGIKKEMYFFDRHPAVFNSVIDFYRTGRNLPLFCFIFSIRLVPFLIYRNTRVIIMFQCLLVYLCISSEQRFFFLLYNAKLTSTLFRPHFTSL